MIIIKLSKAIFNKPVVDRAISDYVGIANVEIKESQLYWECTLVNCIYDETLTEKEFKNHTINLLNCSDL